MEYSSLLHTIVLCSLIAFFIFFVSFVLIYKHHNSDKVSIYECGFDPFSDSRGKFDIRFYLVAILFLVFDLEVILLLPWCAAKSSFFSTFIAFTFLFLLIAVYVYEWKKGGMSWSSVA